MKKKFNMRTSFLFSLIIYICLLASCHSGNTNNSRVETLPYYNDPHFTPNWIESNDNSLKGFHSIPSFSLTNQDGKTVTEKTFEGKIYVTDFFFTTCPGICPKMTNNMKVIQDEFIQDDEVLLLSHSVTPETDSVSRLKAYADSKEIISDKWHIVTVDRNEIYRLGRKAYFVEEDLGIEKDEDEFLHTENFVLIDQNRHIRGIYNGLNTASVQQLIADIRTLQ